MNKVFKPFKPGLFTGLIEVWKDVEGFEGHYQVSSFGRIKSLTRYKSNRWGSLSPVAEKILKQKVSKSGYKVVHLRTEDKQAHPSVHRLVALAFIPNQDSKPTVNHIDTIKTNNNVSNLEWSSHSEQMQHAAKNNLLEVRGAPKYSKEFKSSILDYYNQNSVSLMQLSKMFNISERTAGRIINDGVKPRTTVRVLKNGQTIKQDILTKEQVLEIKKLRAEGWTFARLAEKFDRGLSQMHRVVNNLSRNTEIE